MEIQDNHLLRDRVSNSAPDHQGDSVSVVNILVWMPLDFHWNTETTPNPKDPKGTEDEATT